MKVLPELSERAEREGRRRHQSAAFRAGRGYRSSVVTPADALDAMVITNGAFKLMRDWAEGPIVQEYSLSADFDDHWRTGGTLEEIIEEAHLDAAHILARSSDSSPSVSCASAPGGTYSMPPRGE